MKKIRILLVDDEERYLKTTRKLIERQGHETWIARNGKEALEILDTKTVHVVILDVKMPGMNGNQILKIIKENHPLVEVIMLTGHATVDSAIDGLKTGAFDYLMKPVDVDKIVEKAVLAFEKRMRQEEKIRAAQARQYLRSPREIIKAAQE